MSTCRSSGGHPTDEGGRCPMTLRAGESLIHDLHDQIVVAPAKRSAHAGQAGVAREIGGGIHFEDVGLTLLTEAHVDPAVAFTIGHVLPGFPGNLTDGLEQFGRELCRTHRYSSLVFGTSRDPLGRVAHDGPGSLG